MKSDGLRLSNRAARWCILALAFAGVALFFPMCVVAAQDVAANNSGTNSAASRATRAHVPTNSTALAVDDKYLIGPGDILAINVWKNPEISRTMPVRPDGRISLPLIGEVQAAGRSAMQLQDVVVQKLKRYISQPEVNVSVQEIKSRRFNVIGRVMRAGEYDLPRPMTVIDAISMAGGFQEFAHVKKIYILRPTDGGKPKILHFNYKQVIKGHLPKQNVELQPGDTVVVP